MFIIVLYHMVKFITDLLIVLTAYLSTSPYHNYAIQKPCELISSYFYPYSGFRLLDVSGRGGNNYPTRILAYCSYGTQVCAGRELIKDNYNGGLSWNNTIYCLNEQDFPQCTIQGCFKLARRYQYVGHSDYQWAPNAFVGGLFKCNTADCDDNGEETPILPLLGDDMVLTWDEELLIGPSEEVPGSQWWLPLVYTPDHFSEYYPLEDDRWARYIDINERY
jgi:hypothetical protein